MKESWWVDMIEGEFDGDKFQKVEVLAKYSETDKKIMDNLKKIKSIVKEQMTASVPEDEAYYAKLQGNIMNGIYSFEAKRENESKKKEQIRSSHVEKIKVAKFYFSMGL